MSKILVSPWVPISDPLALKVLGKLAEETCELGSAVSRCIIQGIDEAEPVTGKLNRIWLHEEIADVLATVCLAVQYFGLDMDFIETRGEAKVEALHTWFDLKH